VLVRALAVPGAFEVSPVQHLDDRGVFLEWFREDAFIRATGHPFHLAQANCSVSAAGTLRGLHFTQVPPGQAKLVTCVHGAAFDVTVDLRLGSATFGQWDAVLLDDAERKAVYLPQGVGHAFLSLEDHTVVTYLCSAPHAPAREQGIDPLDPEIGIDWPTTGRDGSPLAPLLSPKDAAAPPLATVREAGLLPTYAEALAFPGSLGG
jgi:dTDP-4-dehydrorhamnose 3,5-epimerase